MTSSSLFSTLRHIFERYSERPNPTLSQLLPLHSSKCSKLSTSQLPISKSSPASTKPERSSPTVKTSHTSISFQIPSSKKQKTSLWECTPFHPDISREQILKEKYPSLENFRLTHLQKPPCGIFVDEEKDEEVLFFNRLSKILTQQLFPTRLIPMHPRMNIFSNDKSLVLGLAPLSVIRYKIPSAQYHESLTQNGCVFLPLYSSLQYEKDTQLKRDLWAILNHQPFAYMQKS